MGATTIRIMHERETLLAAREDARGRVGLIVIQGPLHYRHLAACDDAARECDLVIVCALTSRDEDNYVAAPQALDRPVEAEAEHLEAHGANIYFVPSLDDMYPFGAPSLTISTAAMPQLTETSLYTEAYFSGIVHFYAKLINIVRPSDIYVSQKDLHDLAALRQYVRDFDVPVDVRPVMLARENDGLASDVANHELSEEERTRAVALSRALYRGVQVAASTGSAQAVLEETRRVLEESEGVEIMSVDLLDPFTLSPASVERGTATLLVLARVGNVVLSDNMLVVLRRG